MTRACAVAFITKDEDIFGGFAMLTQARKRKIGKKYKPLRHVIVNV